MPTTATACCGSSRAPTARAATRAESARHADDRNQTSAALADDAPHLLVVDDDRRIRDLLSRFLLAEGYRVTTADTAAMRAPSSKACASIS